jgi:uncharacterized protein YdaU (DUF1376 family)
MANPYMPLYTGDYLRKTRRLTDREHGAYLLILMALWDEGGSLAFNLDDLKQIARVPAKTRNWETSVWPKIAPFFIISEGRISHGRVSETLADLADKRKINTERAHKAVRAKQQKHKQNNGGNQLRDNYELTNQTKGLVSSLREEKPNLAIEHQRSSVNASPPSPLEGGGDATEGEHLAHLRRFLQTRLQGLLTAHVLSAIDARNLKDAIRGGSEDRLLLASHYEPPEHVAAALASVAIDWQPLPKLQAISGGKQ